MASIIVSTAVTAVLLVAVVMYVVRGRNWRSYAFQFGEERESLGEALGRHARDPATWGAGFVLLVLATGLVALSALGAFSLPGPGGVMAVAIVFGLLLTVSVVFGVYGLVRSRDRSTAEATLVTLLLVAGLFVVLVSGNLVFGFLGG